MSVPPTGSRPEAPNASPKGSNDSFGADARGGSSAKLRALRIGLFGLFAVVFATPLGGASWVSAKIFFGVWALAVVSIGLSHARSGASD